MTYTLGSTGQQIINALTAGKSIMVHTVLPNGSDSYTIPSEITFSTSEDSFSMIVNMNIAETFIIFSGHLDSELVVDFSDDTK